MKVGDAPLKVCVPRRPRASLLIVGPVIALTAATGCGIRGSSGPSQPSQHAIGGPTTADTPDVGKNAKTINKSYLVHLDGAQAIVTLVSVKTLTAADAPEITPDSGAFTVLNVRIKAVKGTVHYNALYVKIKQPGKDAVDESDGQGGFGGVKPEIGNGDLTAGKQITGNVSLDVKPAPGSKVTYTDALEQVVASWPL